VATPLVATPPVATPPPQACESNSGCRGLGGDCCPAPTGEYLACCAAPPLVPGPQALPMTPSCDYVNVGHPNCGDAAKCESEYTVSGGTRMLKATSESCAFVTFRTELSLSDVLQLDADVFITDGTCGQLDNLAFWFFQTVEGGNPEEELTSHWDAYSEVDLMETYIGVGGINSINTNFAAVGLHTNWQDVTITGGVYQHVTMWQDVDNAFGCPATRSSGPLEGSEPHDFGKDLPVVSLYVAHCVAGGPCCEGDACKELQSHPDTARACITVKEAPILFALSNWGAGHRVTAGCEVGFSDLTVRTK